MALKPLLERERVLVNMSFNIEKDQSIIIIIIITSDASLSITHLAPRDQSSGNPISGSETTLT